MSLPGCTEGSRKRLKCWQELVQSFSSLSSTTGECLNDELCRKQLRVASFCHSALKSLAVAAIQNRVGVYLGSDVNCVKWSKTCKQPQPDMLHWTFLNTIIVDLVQSHQSSILMIYPQKQRLTTKMDCSLTYISNIWLNDWFCVKWLVSLMTV